MSQAIECQEQTFEAHEPPLNYAMGAKSGSPMLFLHGVTRCWQDFQEVMPVFAPERQVFGLDFRGHGRSGRAEGHYLTTDYIRDGVAFVQSRFDAPCVLFGHSLGAMVAAAIAAEVPEAVQALIVEDPPFETLGAGIFQTSFHAYFSALRELLADAPTSETEMALRLAEMRFPAPDGKTRVRMGDARPPEAIRFHAKCLLRLDPATLEPILAGRWLAGWDWEETLTRISCPTLLLVGDTAFGGMLPIEVADRVEWRIPTMTGIHFKGAGHHLHATQFEKTIGGVKAFLESL
jgi:pimeloyl-ACP methyl ester carboxylesterase